MPRKKVMVIIMAALVAAGGCLLAISMALAGDPVRAIRVNGVTYVPVRFVSESLGATVAWDERTQQVTITDPQTGKEIVLAVGNRPAVDPVPPSPRPRVYLNSLNPTSAEGYDSGDVVLAGIPYARSLQRTIDFHDDNEHAFVVTYALSKRYARFKATVCVCDDDDLGEGKLKYIVADATTREKLFVSPYLQRRSPPATIDIDVSKVNSLLLEVQCDPTSVRDDYDDAIHFAWGDPVLEGK